MGCETIVFLLLLGMVDLLEETIELESKDFPGPASLPERHTIHLQREKKIMSANVLARVPFFRKLDFLHVSPGRQMVSSSQMLTWVHNL